MNAGVDHSIIAQQVAAEHVEGRDRLREGRTRFAFLENVPDEVQSVCEQGVARVSISAIQHHTEFF